MKYILVFMIQIHTTLSGKLEIAYTEALKSGLFGSGSELIRTAIRNEIMKTNPGVFQNE